MAGTPFDRSPDMPGDTGKDAIVSGADLSTVILEALPAFFVAIETDGHIRKMNDLMLRTLEYTSDEVIGQDYLGLFVAGEDRMLVSDIFHQLITRKGPTLNENKILTKTGAKLLVEWRGRFVEKLDGQIDYIFGIGIDITKRKLMEEEFRYQNLLFATQQDAAIDGILVVDENGDVLTYNRQFVEIWGVSSDALDTKKDEVLLNEIRGKLADPDGFFRGVRWLYENRQEKSRDEIALADGRILDRYSSPVIGDDGKHYGRVWYFRDVTDLKDIESELKSHRDHLGQLVDERTREMQEEIVRRKMKEEQYQALVESIVEWVWETNTGFIHTYLSPRIYDVLGYSPDELIGSSPSVLMPDDERKRAMPIIESMIAQNDDFVSFQTICLHKDGRAVFVEANGKPFYDETGKWLGYRGSARDITDQKKFVDALKEREAQLILKSNTLEEVNAALKVLLQQREHDRNDLEDKFVSNIKGMVIPYIQRMQKIDLKPEYRAYLDVAIANLNEILSPFLTSLKHFNFTPKEIEVATLIRNGKTTKEIAEIIGVELSAIHSHRDNVRKKLNLNNKKINLRTFLLSLK